MFEKGHRLCVLICMGRKVYFLSVLFVLTSTSAWGWNGFRAKVGGETTLPYQSSNPTIELKETRNINQQQSEECYLFSFTAALEVANLNGWKRSISAEISAEYLFIQKLIAWSQEVLTNQSTFDDSFYFLDGGDVHHAMKLSVEKGLLPQDLFKPRIKFENWDFPLLYKDVKEIVKEGRKVLANTKDQDVYNQVLQIFIDKIQKRIAKEAGMQPREFNWNGRKWDAHQFESAYGIKRNSHIYMMYPKGSWDMGDPFDLRNAILGMVETFRGAFNYKQSSWNQIWLYLIDSIDSGLPAVLSMKWAGSYHVLNVVGYEYNNRSEIVSFKLKNTWGEDYGDKGHAFFGLQDLQKNVTTVWGFQRP